MKLMATKPIKVQNKKGWFWQNDGLTKTKSKSERAAMAYLKREKFNSFPQKIPEVPFCCFHHMAKIFLYFIS